MKSIYSLCRMLAAAPAGFECTLGGCPREFVEIDRAEFMRILRKEAGLLPVRKRRRPSRRKSDAPLSSPPDDPHISRSETPVSRSAGGLNISNASDISRSRQYRLVTFNKTCFEPSDIVAVVIVSHRRRKYCTEAT